MFMKTILLTFVAFCAVLLAACGDAGDSAADRIQAASEAIAADNYHEAQTIADHVTTNGLQGLTEQNLGRLAIIYMQLSEHDNYDLNAAVATECMREAMRVSVDSMAAFSRDLSQDEMVHFALVRRIATGIDNPVDLTSDDIIGQDDDSTAVCAGDAH